jgi:hypothetical protein
MTRTKVLAVLLCAASLCFAQSINKSSRSVNVKVNGLPAQYTTLRVDTLSRCILNLPNPASITASTEGRTEYLKRISGTDKSDYVKVWNAKAHLAYQWKYRLQYLVMPQGGFEAQAPVFRETDGTTPVSETIMCDPQESDFFAFSSPRRYYFNTPEAASNSAVKNARQRISELKNLECVK